ncbi:hypothetical protein NHF39_18535 [Pseudomonas proteolytica]|nr:hypothetical protein NHF39_18535 [Pseudomonas proteolytica]
MLHSQRVMTNFGRKPRIHSGVDVIRHSMVSLERYIPPTLYRRLFIKRIARHPLAIEGFEFRPVQSLFELEEALRLVNDSYARRGISTVCRAGMRFRRSTCCRAPPRLWRSRINRSSAPSR